MKRTRRMKRRTWLLAVVFLLVPTLMFAQAYREAEEIQVVIAKNPFGASESIIEEGLVGHLEKLNCEIVKNEAFELTPEEQEYGGWARSALVARHLGSLISANGTNEYFTVGLLGSCTDLYGMLAGMQNMGPGAEEEVYHLAGRAPNRVGLIYFDAHADINTPETTLSGMFGGMDVAIAAGLYHRNNRMISGLDPPLPPSYIVLGDVRDTDPREQELIHRLRIEKLSTSDIINLTPKVHEQMRRLSELTDLIYIHVDMDVLAPEEVRGHGLTAPDGPTSWELAACIELMSVYPKTAAIGIASTPYGPRDPEHLSRQAAIRLVEGAIRGIQKRR
jgi:arginase